MSNLSQEDIDALMGGSAGTAVSTSTGSTGKELGDMDERDDAFREDISAYFTHDEIDAIGEISNIAMGTSATTMYALLGRRVTITTPSVGLYKAENALASYTTPFLAISVEYTQGILGKNLLIIKDYDAAVITDLLMGGEGHVEKDNIILNEIHISAMSEVMNQMIGSSATAMANMMDSEVNISPPEVSRATPEDDASKFLDGAPLVIKISFDMEIEGLLKSKLMQIMSVDMAKEMIQQLMHPADTKPEPPKIAPAPAAAAPQPAPAPRPQQTPAARPPADTKRVQPVKPATYQSFDEPVSAGNMNITQVNYDLINDIPLQVTVELGKARKNLSDVMNLGVGSIIVLDKQAGELVDVIVNGKRIAKGEVVVIDENYGVRITEIIR
jgi:flagellar motor switch protein FliN/FliY